MAWKDLLGVEQDDEMEYEDSPVQVNNAAASIGLFEPNAFEDATKIADMIKKGSVVTVNLHRLSKDYAQRTIDFLTGVVYALDGRIEKIGHNLILCSPRSVKVSGVITLTAE